jgi:hypothetical protein
MKTNTLLIGAVIVLLIGDLFFGYMFFFHNNRPGSGFRGTGNSPQMQLSDGQKQSVTSFFESTTNIDEITSYCDNQENRMLCFYYCSQVNPDHEYCSQLMQERPNFQGTDSQNVQRLN